MKYVVLIGFASAALLAGCASRYADAPTPTRWEASRQYKLTAAEHWHRIAGHFATQLGSDLQAKGTGAPLYVPANENGEFPFVEGFREMLTTALVQQGQDVRTRPGEGVQTVDVRYSVYRFDRDREPARYYGHATALAAGLVAIGGVVSGGASFSSLSHASTPSIVGKTVGLATVLDGLDLAWNEGLQGKNARGPTPQSEIVLTASVTLDDRIVTRYSSLYYVADEDAALYWKKRKGTGTQLQVKGEEQ